AGRLKIWEDGTAVMRPNSGTAINGQWYTVNNYALVIIPTSGTTRIYPYLFNTIENLSLINSAGFLQAPYGYFTKQLASTPLITKPVINNLVATEDLAPGNGVLATSGTTDHRLWDMDNIPEEARSQDSRLVDSLTTGWWLGLNAGGEHTYRKDVDADNPDEPGSGQFRFHVYIPGQWNNTLARGSWFTVNNMFLRVYDPNSGARADYMYIVTGTGTNRAFMHLSFQDYERGDNRYFTIYDNSRITGQTEELPTGPPMFMGQSTFRADRSKPRPCPGLPGLGPDGNDIRECDDITIDYDEGVHVYYSSKTDPQTELIRAWLPAQNAVVALKASNDLTMYDFMDAVRPAIYGKPYSMDLLAFEMVEATQSSNGLITGVIRLSYGSYTQDVIINRVIPRLPRASGGQTPVAWNITTDATANGEPFIVTATGLVDGWSLFDLSVIGSSGINNALWFEDCGTVSFNQDVTLSYQGSSTRAVAAGEVVVIDASMSEWAVSLDGGNFLTFIAQNSCGNFCGLPPERDLADFPGTLEPIYAPTTWLITPDAPVNGKPLIVMANGLVDGWSQFDLSLIFGGGPGPFTYAIWFEDGGTVSFNQDVTLSYQGASFREVAAGELLEIDASTSEWAVSLDDGNSLILIAQNSCGNFCGLPPALDFADFPGMMETLIPTTAWIVEPQASYNGSQLTITATGLIEDWLEFDLGALIGSGSGFLFNHVLYFEEGAALTFNQDVDLRYQGTIMRTVLLGEVFYLTEDTIEYGVTLDDGNTVVFVLESDAGYYGSIGAEPDLPLSAFPGNAYIENGADACIVN
ncbi:MAG: hypothetical protein FWF13_00410, partial [Acidobacteria bacterium]|nr:hypothetical protein [Acidobacteriota bacterium]